MSTKTAKVGAAIFRYTDPDTGGRRYAHRGDTVELTEKDYERLKNGGGLYKKLPPPKDLAPGAKEAAAEAEKKAETSTTKEPPPPATTSPGVTDLNPEYDAMSVSKAVEYLESIPEDQRAPFFAHETERQRKGVLSHFDQPITWE